MGGDCIYLHNITHLYLVRFGVFCHFLYIFRMRQKGFHLPYHSFTKLFYFLAGKMFCKAQESKTPTCKIIWTGMCLHWSGMINLLIVKQDNKISLLLILTLGFLRVCFKELPCPYRFHKYFFSPSRCSMLSRHAGSYYYFLVCCFVLQIHLILLLFIMYFLFRTSSCWVS